MPRRSPPASRVSGSSSKPACTTTGTGTTIPASAATPSPTRSGLWMARVCLRMWGVRRCCLLTFLDCSQKNIPSPRSPKTNVSIFRHRLAIAPLDNIGSCRTLLIGLARILAALSTTRICNYSREEQRQNIAPKNEMTSTLNATEVEIRTIAERDMMPGKVLATATIC